MNTHQNPMCDGSHCTSTIGEVRFLPISTNGGNLIVCRACWAHELRWRRERNRELGIDAHFSVPAWETLKPYDPQGEPWR